MPHISPLFLRDNPNSSFTYVLNPTATLITQITLSNVIKSFRAIVDLKCFVETPLLLVTKETLLSAFFFY